MIECYGLPSDTSQRDRADKELLRQTTYLNELFELAPDAIVLTTIRNPRILRVNRAFTRMFGYTAEESAGNCIHLLVIPDGVQAIDPPEDLDLITGGIVEREALRQRKDGTQFHAHITAKPIRFNDEEDAGYLIYRDVSARNESEALLADEKLLLEIISASRPLTSTLDALCRLAEDVDPRSVGSILLLDRKGKRIRAAVGPGLPASYMAALDGRTANPTFAPCGAAARLGKQVVCRGIADDERWANQYRALALAHGLRACCSTPIKSWQGRVLGTFAIYRNEPESPSPEQRERVEQFTHVAGVAIEHAHAIDDLRRLQER
jgi:PAS domain S-box-containing protein